MLVSEVQLRQLTWWQSAKLAWYVSARISFLSCCSYISLTSPLPIDLLERRRRRRRQLDPSHLHQRRSSHLPRLPHYRLSLHLLLLLQLRRHRSLHELRRPQKTRLHLRSPPLFSRPLSRQSLLNQLLPHQSSSKKIHSVRQARSVLRPHPMALATMLSRQHQPKQQLLLWRSQRSQRRL